MSWTKVMFILILVPMFGGIKGHRSKAVVVVSVELRLIDRLLNDVVELIDVRFKLFKGVDV